MKKRILLCLPIILLAVTILIVGTIHISSQKNQYKKIIVESTLIDTINISELYTSQFTYNGISVVYKDDNSSKIKCHVRYNAKVKAGIDASAVKFDINHKNLTVKPILPEITLSVDLIEKDSFSLIPSNAKVELDELLLVCKNDAKNEALKSTELILSSEDNIKATIEALLLPILEPNGYSLVWE